MITKAGISLTPREKRTYPAQTSIRSMYPRALVWLIPIKQIRYWISISSMEENFLHNMIKDISVPIKTFIRIRAENSSRKKWVLRHENIGMSYFSEIFKISKNQRSLTSKETKYVMSVTSNNRSAALRKRPINYEYILLWFILTISIHPDCL